MKRQRNKIIIITVDHHTEILLEAQCSSVTISRLPETLANTLMSTSRTEYSKTGTTI